MVFRAIGSDIVNLGMAFGLLDSASGRAVSAFMSGLHLMTTMVGVMNAYTVSTAAATGATTGLSAALGTLGGPIAIIIGIAIAIGGLAYAFMSMADAQSKLADAQAKVQSGARDRTFTRDTELDFYRSGLMPP